MKNLLLFIPVLLSFTSCQHFHSKEDKVLWEGIENLYSEVGDSMVFERLARDTISFALRWTENQNSIFWDQGKFFSRNDTVFFILRSGQNPSPFFVIKSKVNDKLSSSQTIIFKLPPKWDENGISPPDEIDSLSFEFTTLQKKLIGAGKFQVIRAIRGVHYSYFIVNEKKGIIGAFFMYCEEVELPKNIKTDCECKITKAVGFIPVDFISGFWCSSDSCLFGNPPF